MGLAALSIHSRKPVVMDMAGHMLIYPVTSVGTPISCRLQLADWPEVCLPGSTFSEEKLNAALRVAVREHAASARLIPLPRSKPRSDISARLSLGESLKVMVLNEMIKKDVSYHSLAGTLCMPPDFIRAGLDISGATDLELLDKVVGALGRRWFAYVA